MIEELKDRDGVGLIYGNVGSNDKYLINKLRSYNISLEKIDSYLKKLSTDNTMDTNRMALNNLVSYLQFSSLDSL